MSVTVEVACAEWTSRSAHPRHSTTTLGASFEDSDSALIAAALGNLAKVRGMTKVAVDAGQGSESLYKALSRNSNSGFATVLKVMRALGLGLRHFAASGPAAG